jgi:hypothetical protein
MAESIRFQVENLRLSIDRLEAQRVILGENFVSAALTALNHQLSQLREQVWLQDIPVQERHIVTILLVNIVGSNSITKNWISQGGASHSINMKSIIGHY